MLLLLSLHSNRISPLLQRKSTEAIAQISEELAQVDVALQKVTESGEKLKSKLEEIKAVSQDVTRTFIDGLIEGKSATEALSNALKRFGNKLLDSGLNALFDGIFKGIGSGGSGGSGGGGLFVLLFRADGGEVRNKPNGMIRGKGASYHGQCLHAIGW